MYNRESKRVEGFELVVFGGHRRVNRRTTRIQIRRDARLLGQGRQAHWQVSVFVCTDVLNRGPGENEVFPGLVRRRLREIVKELGREFVPGGDALMR